MEQSLLSKCLTRTYKKTRILNIKIRHICLFNSYNKFKVQVVCLVFFKFGLNILIWEISPWLLMSPILIVNYLILDINGKPLWNIKFLKNYIDLVNRKPPSKQDVYPANSKFYNYLRGLWCFTSDKSWKQKALSKNLQPAARICWRQIWDEATIGRWDACIHKTTQRGQGFCVILLVVNVQHG